MGSLPRFEWTQESIDTLCKLKLHRYSHRRIASFISAKFHKKISESIVSTCWMRLVDSGYFEDKPEYLELVDRALKGRFEDADNPYNCKRRANILHLLDLKRAGHSPTKTELKIDGDFWPKRLEVHGELRSYCGSSSYLCAMEG